MDTLRLHHHAHEGNLDELKFAALYFEKIEVPVFQTMYLQPSKENPKRALYTSENRSASNKYLEHVKVLEDEGILEISKENYHPNLQLKNHYDLTGIPFNVGLYVGDNLDRLFKEKGKPVPYRGSTAIEYTGEMIEELMEVKNYIRNQNSTIGTYSYYFEPAYIITQIQSIIEDINAGKITCTTSSLIDSFIKDFILSKELRELQQKFRNTKNIETLIAFNALQVHLPTVQMLSFEDILEIRTSMKDELQAFQYELKNLAFNFQGQNLPLSEIETYTQVNITPKLKSLEAKLKSLDKKFLRTYLSEIKDPKTYSPLLLTLFSNISSSMILLASLGLVTITSAIDQSITKNEIKNDGLYFLANLRRRLSV